MAVFKIGVQRVPPQFLDGQVLVHEREDARVKPPGPGVRLASRPHVDRQRGTLHLLRIAEFVVELRDRDKEHPDLQAPEV